MRQRIYLFIYIFFSLFFSRLIPDLNQTLRIAYLVSLGLFDPSPLLVTHAHNQVLCFI